ncbi:MAG: S8 family serine peptidase, partial [Synergistaceae bacterium]|nr:S8 family serine peptidase [Synergistaceae bacterium]
MHAKKLCALSCFLLMLVLAAVAGLALTTGACAAEVEYAPGEVLVLLRGGTALGAASSTSAAAMTACADRVALSAGARTAKVYESLSAASGGQEIFALLKSDSKTTDEILANLSANPDVLAASPNYVKHSAKTPNDPSYGSLWGMPAINAPAAWDITTGSDTDYIAVADSGIDATHPDLAANVDLGLSINFTEVNDPSRTAITDYAGHGTHVSGTIAAVGNNGLGIAGVNWRTKLIVLKTMEKSGSSAIGYNADFALAIDYLISLLNQGKRISALNLSISGVEYGTPETHTTTDVLWKAFKRLSDTNKTLIVVAADNDGAEVGVPTKDSTYVYPASYIGIDNMIVVGAMDGSAAARISNYSDTMVDIAAPGTNIYSTLPGGKYGRMSGTSMATPHVVGVIGLMASVAPGKAASDLKSALLDNTNYTLNPIHPIGKKKLSRCGMLDAAAAVAAVEEETDQTTVEVSPKAITLQVGDSGTLSATVYGADSGVTWRSSNEAVATVSDGVVSAISAGTAVITAASVYNSDASDSCVVTVTAVDDNIPSDLELSRKTLDLQVGDSGTLSVTVYPDGADGSVEWSSDNEAVATVSDGVVRGISAGTAVITATSVYNPDASDSCVVMVSVP